METIYECPRCHKNVTLDEKCSCPACDYYFMVNEVLAPFISEEGLIKLKMSEQHPLYEAYHYYLDEHYRKALPVFESISASDEYYGLALLGIFLIKSEGGCIPFVNVTPSYLALMKEIIKRCRIIDEKLAEAVHLIALKYKNLNQQVYNEQLALIEKLEMDHANELVRLENEARTLELEKAEKINQDRIKAAKVMKGMQLILPFFIAFVFGFCLWLYLPVKSAYLIPLTLPFIYGMFIKTVVDLDNNEKKYYLKSVSYIVLLNLLYIIVQPIAILIVNIPEIYSLASWFDELWLIEGGLLVVSLIQLLYFFNLEHRAHGSVEHYEIKNTFDVNYEDVPLKEAKEKLEKMKFWMK